MLDNLKLNYVIHFYPSIEDSFKKTANTLICPYYHHPLWSLRSQFHDFMLYNSLPPSIYVGGLDVCLSQLGHFYLLFTLTERFYLKGFSGLLFISHRSLRFCVNVSERPHLSKNGVTPHSPPFHLLDCPIAEQPYGQCSVSSLFFLCFLYGIFND